MKDISKNDFFYVVDDNYDEHIDLAIPFYKEMHNEISNFLNIGIKSPKILDLGCGTGVTTSVLLDFYPQAKVIAIDLFDEMLNRAKKRLVNYTEQITYIQGDFRKIDWESNIDICISSLALHHILPYEKNQLFDKIYKTLSDDGIFIMIDWTKFNSNNIQKKAFENAEKHADKSVTNKQIVEAWTYHWENINIPDTVEDLIEWLKNSEFRNVNCVFRYYGLAMIIAEK